MALPDFDSFVGCTFGLEIDGVMLKSIQEVSGLKFEMDVSEQKANTPDGKLVLKKSPARPKAGEFTVTRGLTADKALEKWAKASQQGKMGEARKNGCIIIFDYEGAAIKRYNFQNGWVKSLELGSLKAGDAATLTEKATVTYESMAPE